MYALIRKIEELKDAASPFNKEVGYERLGKFYDPPKVGECFYVGSLRTSRVTEIIDENTFKTMNSIYTIRLIPDEEINRDMRND